MPEHRAQRPVDVRCLGDDLEPGLGIEQQPQARANDPVVVGQHDARPGHVRDPTLRAEGRHDRAVAGRISSEPSSRPPQATIAIRIAPTACVSCWTSAVP